MKKESLKSLLIVFVFFANLTNAITDDVQKVINHSLFNDDIAQKMNLFDQFENKFEYVINETATMAGLNAKKIGQIIYFAYGSNIRRYDLNQLMWLDDIPLIDEITSFNVDESGIYVSHNRSLYKYYENNPRVFFTNSPSDIKEINVLNNFIVIKYGDTLVSFDKDTGSYISEGNVFYGIQGMVSSKIDNKIYGYSQNVSPADILEVKFNESGIFLGVNDSPYHGNYPGSNRVYKFPDDSRILGGSGVIYHSSDLAFGGSINGNVEHVDFYGDLIIIIRNGDFVSFSNTFMETGSFDPEIEPDLFFISDETIVAFNYESNNINVELYDISVVNPNTPGLPIDPNGLVYTPDEIIYDQLETIYLLHRNSLSIFKYNLRTESYTDNITLDNAPLFMTHSKENNSLYLAYSDGVINKISLENEILHEELFTNSPPDPCGLAMAGEYLFLCNPIGTWVSHMTYSPMGELISQEEWNYFSRTWEWSSVNRRMYHFRNDTSPNDLLSEVITEEGVIGEQIDSPFHGGVSWIPPICINPDGSNVILGSGVAYNSLTLEESGFLSNNISACSWFDHSLYTLSDHTSSSNLQMWSSNFEGFEIDDYEGTPLSLFNYLDDSLIIISDIDGIPTINKRVIPLFKNNFEFE